MRIGFLCLRSDFVRRKTDAFIDHVHADLAAARSDLFGTV